MAKSKYHQYKFNYPLEFDNEYTFPTKYYLNVQTGRSIIKKSQLKMMNSVIVNKDGEITEIPDDKDNDSEEDES